MGDWRTQGSAQRRREGAPASHVAGAWTLPTPHLDMGGEIVAEAVAGMAKTGAPRVPVGDSVITGAVNLSGQPSANTHTRPRAHSKAVDPAYTPYEPQGSHTTLAPAAGAAYGIRANVMPPSDPTAGPTQGNGRIVSSAVNRSRPAFDDDANRANNA